MASDQTDKELRNQIFRDAARSLLILDDEDYKLLNKHILTFASTLSTENYIDNVIYWAKQPLITLVTKIKELKEEKIAKKRQSE